MDAFRTIGIIVITISIVIVVYITISVFYNEYERKSLLFNIGFSKRKKSSLFYKK